MQLATNLTAAATQHRRFVKCGEKPGTIGCGKPITFDKNFWGKNQGWVPLEEITDSVGQKSLKVHECPGKNSSRNKEQQIQQQQSISLPATQTQQSQQRVTDIQVAQIAQDITALSSKIESLSSEISQIKVLLSTVVRQSNNKT